MTSWMIGQSALTALRTADRDLASRFFNTPASYLIGFPPSGWLTIPVRSFTSYAAYFSNTNLNTRWVLYDPEKWDATPVKEQQDPKVYMVEFARLAHSRNQKLIVSPARNLTAVSGAHCNCLSGEKADEAYLRCGFPEGGAGSDIFECQAQANQGDVGAYTRLVTGAQSQLPVDHLLWAGLTTLRGDSVSAMVGCYEAVVGMVDGFWLNSSSGTISTAVRFLERISAL